MLDDWPAFVHWLNQSLGTSAPAKEALPAVGPFTGSRAKGGPGIAMVTVGALDVDAGLPAVDPLVASLAALGLDAVVHTSPSDPGADSRKVRVFVHLARPLAPAECRPFRKGLSLVLGVTTDPRALDPTRIFFVGHTTDRPAPTMWTTYGGPIDPTPVVALGGGPDLPEAALLPAPAGGAPEDLIARTAAALESAWAEDGHQAWALQFFGWCAGNGWDAADLVALVAELGAPDQERADKYRSMAERAEPLSGPSEEVRAALGPAFDEVDSLVHAHPAGPGARDPAGEFPTDAEREAARLEAARAAAVASAPAGEPFPALCRIEDWTAPIPERQYMFPALKLDQGKISVVGGFAGTGKGPFVNLMAVHRAAGLPLFGSPVRQGHVLFLDAETGEEAKRRLQRISAGLGLPAADVAPYLHFGTLVPAQDPKMWMWDLARAAEQWPDLLVVLDSYTSAMFASALESADPRYATLAHELGMFSRDKKALVVATMHAKKDVGAAAALTDIAGTNALAAMTQTAVLLRRPSDKDEFAIEVSCARAPAGRFDPFVVRWEGVEPDPLTCRIVPPSEHPSPPPTKADAKQAKRDEDERIRRAEILDVLSKAGATLPVTEIRRHVTGRHDAVKDSVLALVREGAVIDIGAGQYTIATGASAAVTAFTLGHT